MFKNPLKHWLVCLLGCLSIGVGAQELRQYQYHRLLQGSSLNLQIPALDYPEVLKNPSNGSINKYKLNFESQYRLRYSPTSGFKGIDTLVYRVNRNINGAAVPHFEGVIVQVVDIDPARDYYTLRTSDSEVFLPIIENDLSVDTNLKVVQIVYTQNGTARISDDGSGIVFSPADVGYSHIQYLACNDIGCASSEVLIRVDDPADPFVTTNENYHVKAGESAVIVLPPGHTAPNGGYYNGTLTRETDQIYRYRPKDGDLSTTKLKFSKWRDNRYIFSTATVHVSDPFDNNGWSNDDHIFTEVDNEVTFSVVENDIGGQLMDVIEENLEGELEMLGDGMFTYLPSKGFAGRCSFDYISCADGRCDTARVHLVTHNYEPRQEFWQLTALRNQVLSLSYDVPIDAYRFKILSQPINGTLTLSDEGQHMDYQPHDNFIGADATVIEYCVQNGDREHCRALSLFIDVVSYDQPSDACNTSCVWPGDANDDGWVTIEDIMPIGANLGSNGMSRDYSDLSDWYGRQSIGWTGHIAFGTSDLSHADCDGNGFVSTSDLDPVTLHYGKSHQLVAKQPLAVDPLQLDLVLLTPHLQIGDQAIVEVRLDQDIDPNDILGVNFSVQINRFFVDSSSLAFHISADQMEDPEAGVLSYAISPKDGQLDVGLVKTDKSAIVEHGVLGHITFIVEEDLNGFRSTKDLIEIGIELRDVHTLSAEGTSERHLDNRTSFLFSKKPAPVRKGVFVYPNPTDDLITIESSREIAGYRIMNLHGQTILNSESKLNAKAINIDLSRIPSALYFLNIRHVDGSEVIERVQVIR